MQAERSELTSFLRPFRRIRGSQPLIHILCIKIFTNVECGQNFQQTSNDVFFTI